jgi:glycogen operon protein
MRAFWRGDPGKIGQFAERFAGSSDVFRHNGRKPTASINFLAAHDGMTLNDVVSYNQRHNEANLENNADGSSDNLSWNCGTEGPTDDAGILNLRKRQMRNFLATLFLSQGVPMLQAGDEFGRTQRGNNNAYCQDNEISWVDWGLRAVNRDLLEFVQRLAQLRHAHAQFRRETFLKGTASRGGVKDVTWLNVGGTEMRQAEWQDANLRALGIWFGGHGSSAGRGAAGEHDGSTGRGRSTGHFLLLANAAEAGQSFVLPAAPKGTHWNRLFDTALPEVGSVSLNVADVYALAPRSIALLEC